MRWLLSCLSAIFSRSLEMKGRLETGRYLLRLFGSRLCFLRRGRTIAVLKAVGKEPARRDELTKSVMAGRRCERHLEKTEVGIGSSSQEVRDISFKVFSMSD